MQVEEKDSGLFSFGVECNKIRGVKCLRCVQLVACLKYLDTFSLYAIRMVLQQEQGFWFY